MSTCAPIDGKKPSPSRPARLAAASEWPPITMGTVPFTGLGLELTSSNFTNWPAKLAPSSAHSFRITAMYSSVRAPRFSNGTPTASNSSFSQPTPTPSSMRPPLM